MATISPDDRSRYFRNKEILSRHFNDEVVAGRTAALTVDARRWRGSARARASKLRRKRSAARRALGYYLKARPGLDAVQVRAIERVATMLDKASIAERACLGWARLKPGRRPVVMALVGELVPHERGSAFWESARVALREVDPSLSSNSVEAAQAAARRGMRILDARRVRPFAGIREVTVRRPRGAPTNNARLEPAWEFGVLPAVELSELVKRIEWVRQQLESRT